MACTPLRHPGRARSRLPAPAAAGFSSRAHRAGAGGAFYVPYKSAPGATAITVQPGVPAFNHP